MNSPNESRFSGGPAPIRAPRHLKLATRRWWLEIIEQFELESYHIRLLTLAGEAWDRCVSAREALAKEGLTYDDRFGAPHARPEVAIERDSRLGFARLLRELALDVEPPRELGRPPALRG